jgi:hypothetical protein
MFYLMDISLSYYAQPLQQYKWEKGVRFCERDEAVTPHPTRYAATGSSFRLLMVPLKGLA